MQKPISRWVSTALPFLVLLGWVAANSQTASVPDADADRVADYCDRCPAVSDVRQRDTDGDGLGDACDGDFDNDGFVTIADFNLFLPDFISSTDSGMGTDMDGDGAVGISDFNAFLPQFQRGVPGPGASPSPGLGASGGGCFDDRWGRAPWPVQGARTASDLGCSTTCQQVHQATGLSQAVKDAACPSGPFGAFAAGFDLGRNPTDWAIANVVAPGSSCPNAAFSTGDAFAPRACDKHGLCTERCGYKTDDCHRELHRDLVETCQALQGAEATTCQAVCLGFAEAFGSLRTGSASPPVGSSGLGWAPSDEQDVECGCCPPLCATDGDCPTPQRCLGGACMDGSPSLAGSGCTIDSDCGPGFVCLPDGSGAPRCFPGPANRPVDRAGWPFPVCGDGVCDPVVESCTASGCPEDCGDLAAPFVPGLGRCGLDEPCLDDVDCAGGNCSFEGRCVPAPEGAPCAGPASCASLICANDACALPDPASTAVCGDGTCDSSAPDYESEYSCPQDCGFCGDRQCRASLGEDCTSCATDCGFCGGEPCLFDFQCGINAYCDSGSGTCSGGSFKSPGQDCSRDKECSSGTCNLSQAIISFGIQGGLCAYSCGNGSCENGHPLIEETPGNCPEDCGAGDPGSPCLSDSGCTSGFCIGGFCLGSCGDGFCTTWPNQETCKADGCQADCGACGTFTPCDTDADCASGSCSGSPGLCEGAGDLPVGNFCILDSECSTGLCHFVGVGVCENPGALGAGVACSRNEVCSSGACIGGFCLGSCGDGVCTTWPNQETCYANSCQTDCGACPDGTPCGIDADCAGGICGPTLQCLTANSIPNGSPCLDDRECTSGLCSVVCLSAGVLDPGDPCLRDGECKSNACIGGFCLGSCGDGFCTALPNQETCYANSCQADCGACPNGTPCGTNADCGSGYCTLGFCTPQCGNGVCDGSETCSSCGIDCGVCPFCGDLTCGPGENCSNCGIDCGVCPFCGDLSCNNGETCSTCSIDCGACCRGFTAACSSNSQCCSGNCATDIFGNKSCGL